MENLPTFLLRRRVPPPPPVHVSCGRTDILLVRLPPTPVVWRNGGGAGDVRVARRFFFQQTLLPLPPPKVQRLEAQPPQTFTRQRLCPTVQERPPVRVNLLIACRTPSETQPPMGQGSPASTLRGPFRLERSSGDKDVLQADRSGDQGPSSSSLDSAERRRDLGWKLRPNPVQNNLGHNFERI